jgi:hypothetical protein
MDLASVTLLLEVMWRSKASKAPRNNSDNFFILVQRDAELSRAREANRKLYDELKTDQECRMLISM